ncbi:MAG: protein O-mannosyl-transferase family [Kiritimatiellia bacterium]
MTRVSERSGEDVAPNSEAVEAGKPFFHRSDWLAFSIAFFISFAVYFVCLPPSVTLEDSGELCTAGDALGVPHPPGYPIWSALAWIFSRIFLFVTYRGQPNPAWSIALMSGFFGALAAGITAMLISRSGSEILKRSSHRAYGKNEFTERLICSVSGVVSSLLFAFSPVEWSQAVIAEVYSLNAFFLTLIFLLLYMWLERPSDRVLYAMAFAFGLGLTNYQVLLLLAPALVVAVMFRDLELFRDFCVTAVPYGIILLLIRLGVLKGIVHPLHWTCFLHVFLDLLILTLAYFLLPRGKTVAVTLLLAQLGVAFYLFMPLVSDLRNPPMNWAYPRTWEGFKHAITRGQYEKITPSNMFSEIFIHQIGAYLSDLRGQFTLPITLLGFLPFTVWEIKVGAKRFRAISAAVFLCIVASFFTVLWSGFRIDKILIAGVLVLLVLGGAALAVHRARYLLAGLSSGQTTKFSERIMIVLISATVVLLYLAYAGLMVLHILELTAPLRATGAKLASDQVRAIGLKAAAMALAIVLPVALLALAEWLRRSTYDLDLTIDSNSQSWIVATLMGFLTMSVVLISLANLKLDVQDTFIQRVKFISSHALYSFWIGYGLVFGLAFVDELFRGNRWMRNLSLGVALLLPLVPIYENFTNEELVRISGGAEQTGHDFGWQFGNYQLRGAEAINEELSPDEEPLPNPAYPRAMGQNAIFFGGTDPGRFVPTYMIYGARVREDVYLITQNALADNTYMSVMRDLYGDRIWIPAQPDSARAFQRYVEEVKAGIRPQNAELKIENGRVQVSGALGVMEINGILAQMIFENNNYRHDFYVEESYVIRWMYPYLEPHGLIMKINREKIRLTPEMVRRDMDFWDWYCRRLLSDYKFRRDVVARKSFSKLRSAIAGLYANTPGRIQEAENAFHHSRLLYPLSPEANFRLVQEVYMRQERIRESREVMTEFGKLDPLNSKVPEFLQFLDRIEGTLGRISELEALIPQGKLDVNRALDLADLYRKAGDSGKFMAILNGIIGDPKLPPAAHFRAGELLAQSKQYAEMVKALDLCMARMTGGVPPEVYLRIASHYAAAQKADKMSEALQRYLKLRPTDWKAWLDLATVQMIQKDTNGALTALEQALRLGGAQALDIVQKDPRFASLRDQALRRIRGPLPLPESGVLPPVW